MKPIDAVFTTLFAVAIVAVVVAQHAQTSNAILQGFGALASIVTTIMNPLSNGSNGATTAPTDPTAPTSPTTPNANANATANPSNWPYSLQF
jgi:hypothetical protein